MKAAAKMSIVFKAMDNTSLGQSVDDLYLTDLLITIIRGGCSGFSAEIRSVGNAEFQLRPQENVSDCLRSEDGHHYALLQRVRRCHLPETQR